MKRRRTPRSNDDSSMGMARKCCVRNCETDVREARTRALPLHKFPRDASLRTRWLISGGFEEGFKATPGQVVCHRHFKRADYETARGHKFLLKRGSVPSVFTDYDNHPDPVVMAVKSTTSYAQQDLDLINAKVFNLEHSVSSSLTQVGTSKSDNRGEASYVEPESSVDDDVHLPECSESIDNECPIDIRREKIVASTRDELIKSSEIKVNTVAMQLGIVESAAATMKTVAKDLIKLSDSKEFDKTEDLKPKLANRDGLKFFPGAKLEAKDFNDKWYSAKVVETDWDEREVLIHFDKWSSRFDEWIPMDSSRLRVLQTPSSERAWILPTMETKPREFSVGERILATWADGRKYPAKVKAILTNDRYDVLFDDGYAKIVKSSKMTKIAATSSKSLSELEGYIGSKQERRDKKRKHTIMELFYNHSRKRTKNDSDKMIKKVDNVAKENVESCKESKVETDATLFGTSHDSATDLLRGFDVNTSKIKSYPKKSKKDILKNEVDYEEDVGPEWINGEPQGMESYIVDGNDGPRRSIIVPDRRLPLGWEKHFTQRKAGTCAGKWDVLFIHKQTGKKFRSRNDIRVFMENQGHFDFDPEKFDFCIHRKKRNPALRTKPDVISKVPKKIKTLLPKAKSVSTADSTLFGAIANTVEAPIASTSTSVATGAVFIGGLRVEMEDSAYKCPKEGCNKNFRKENLLQMHIKHYHPEYSKFLGSTPKVEDLAYARTIGESIEDIIPKKSTPFVDKINKFSKKKCISDKTSSTLLQSTINIIQPTSPLVAVPVMPELEEETDQSEKYSDSQKENMKIETMSPMSSHAMEVEENVEKKRESACAMSPGTLFDMKVKEEKTQVGIKTLLPVRPPATSDVQKVDRGKCLDDFVYAERIKNQKKKHSSEYNTDLSIKGRRRHGVSDSIDDFGDLDDSAMDVEGPAALMYRYSRRKSESKSDENSQNSQLNDSRLEKGGDSLKGEANKTDINNDTEESEGVMMMINGEMVKVEQLRREEIINCTCGFMEEDGLMIQCDLCLCWQHGHCNAIEREKDVPEKYICYICQHPYRQRPSKKYFHDQDWIKEGKLPSLSKRTRNQEALNKRTAMLKRSYDLVAILLYMQQVLHSLRVKINIATEKDHPKLYLWAKNWEKADVPRIDTKPVPIMETMNSVTDAVGTISEIVRNSETRIESKLSVKDDLEEKSIASDSELMKILEEDSANSEESRIMSKREGQSTIDPKDSHILLDALTSGTLDTKQRDLAVSDVKTKHAMDSSMEEKTFNDTREDGSKTLIDGIQEDSNVENELSVPLQPIIPEPEAPIDPTECRMRLLEHVEDFQCYIDSRLTFIDSQVSALEAMDDDTYATNSAITSRMNQTVQMLLRDLSTVRKLAAFN